MIKINNHSKFEILLIRKFETISLYIYLSILTEKHKFLTYFVKFN